jgi:hypothetical protein
MAKAGLMEQHADAAQAMALFQQSQRQKHKFRAISLAAGALQRAARCFRARKAANQRRFIRDSDNLILRRGAAASAIKSAWKGGRSRRTFAGLLAKRTADKTNYFAGCIQCVAPQRLLPGCAKAKLLWQDGDEGVCYPEVVEAAVRGGKTGTAGAGAS